MNGLRLHPHPATPTPQVDALLVALSSAGDGGLTVAFDCRCRAGLLSLPELRGAEAADELWRHTCCELFLGVRGDPAYREFNWSPSGEWAMYAFSAYRERVAHSGTATVLAPAIEFDSEPGGWTLRARIDALALPEVAAAQIEIGVAVVLESAERDLSYWALRHAQGRPDFHDRETFVLRLADFA
ncbi:MAG: DOMON-like domain-containing protein [Burkholderiales bacterium]|nr:DOMON-like domain-containing protein [Burkholderiales bacterium]